MPVCEQCDGESFYEEDGRFFCASCHMQSQDRQVEHQQEVDAENFNDGTRGLTLKRLGKSKSRKKFKNNDLGKPWTIYEGYQYLIKRQVESLVAMGFTDQLKDVVGKLWFRYLKMKKVAFCPEEPSIITLKEHSGRTKNEGEWSTWLKKHRKLWKDDSTTTPIKADEDLSKKTENAADIEMKDDSEDMKDMKDMKLDDGIGVLAESFNDSNNCNINADNGVKGDDQEIDKTNCTGVSNDNASSHDFVGSSSITKAPIFPMNQATTLYFCYIGLKLLHEPVLLSDLLRWAHEGIIPYHKASVVLPEEMKFAANDHRSFSTKKKLLCSYDALRDVALLHRTLSIDCAPEWEYIKVLVVPVLLDLGFSSTVQQVVWWLIDVDSKLKCPKIHETGCHHCKKAVMDFFIAAYIIVALKIIYYLDDFHEVRNEARNHVLHDLKLPGVEKWTSWVKHTMIKRAKKLYSGIPREEDDLKYIHDLTVYEDYCVKDMYQDFNVRVATQPYQNNMGTWRHRRDMTQIQDPRKEHFETYYSIAKLANPSLDFEKVKRVGSSFPCSVDSLGNPVSCCGEMLHGGPLGHAASCLVTNDEVIKGKSADAPTVQPLVNHGAPSVIKVEPIIYKVDESEGDMGDVDLSADKCADTTESVVELKVPVDTNAVLSNIGPPFCNCYIYYCSTDREDVWSDSYKYLMNLMALRMETIPSELQPFVNALETRLFRDVVR